MQHRCKLLICHKAAKQLYDTFKLVVQCLHKQFQEAIHEDYFVELDDPDVSLTNTLPSMIDQQIINSYAKIDLKMVNENLMIFNEPMDVTKLSAVCTKKQDWCQAFAADARNPITMVNMVQMGVTHAVATQVMQVAYHEWKQIQQVECNWDRWKSHFSDAFHELKILMQSLQILWDMLCTTSMNAILQPM